MELSDQFSEALGELEDFACTITWNGKDYPVFPGSAVLGKDLGAGGFKLRSDLKFIVRSDLFPGGTPQPQLKQSITYLNKIYGIDTIERIPGGAFVRFECNDPDAGA